MFAQTTMAIGGPWNVLSFIVILLSMFFFISIKGISIIAIEDLDRVF